MLELPTPIRRMIAANAPWEWAGAGGIVLGVLVVGLLLRRLARRQSARYAATDHVELMEIPFEIATRTHVLFIVLGALYAGLGSLAIAAKSWSVISNVMVAVTFWQVGLWASAGVNAWLSARRKASTEADRAAASSLGIIGFVARVLVWSLVLLLALENFGVDITALVAGLGVGGLAVALAVQNVLGDLFASLSITLDRPFVIGDLITLGEFSGTVEHIGVKSTRVRSINGEQIVMANADLLGSRLRNFGRMKERRVLFTIGVTYETPRAKLVQIPTLIQACIARHEVARFDRCHFVRYGAFSLDFETVYFVTNPDFQTHLDAQQSILFAIHEAFEQAGIEMAYPTQKLWLEHTPHPAALSASR